MLHKYQNLSKYIKKKEEKIETFRPTKSNTYRCDQDSISLQPPSRTDFYNGGPTIMNCF